MRTTFIVAVLTSVVLLVSAVPVPKKGANGSSGGHVAKAVSTGADVVASVVSHFVKREHHFHGHHHHHHREGEGGTNAGTAEETNGDGAS
ncbi:hypothetical protein FRC20_008457 [Serendipita sp. 405]|nr:hypothetical protein FRC15_010316 [Serendipita sp. 397]KAG8819986.1 hypothetical protein FRC18_011870 [Serendipita sp. 400]KAG8866471.1 hypothetical protein FRC20_008457 [Serendipita sp. 405]